MVLTYRPYDVEDTIEADGQREAKLLETSPAAKRLAAGAKGALVFPNIVKAGFIVGIQYGGGRAR